MGRAKSPVRRGLAAWASLLLAAALGAQESPERLPCLTATERGDLQQCLAALAEAFQAGNAEAALKMFAPRHDTDLERQERIRETLEREFAACRYLSLEFLDQPVVEDCPNEATWIVWVRMRIGYEDRNTKLTHTYHHNDTFIVTRLEDGRFRLADSPWFDTLGKRQRLGLLGDVALLAIGMLAALAFWVWMGFEAHWLRPRSHAWRLIVVLLPLLGAIAFFAAKYVPEWQRRRHLGIAT